jgi:hypothetical protein
MKACRSASQRRRIHPPLKSRGLPASVSVTEEELQAWLPHIVPEGVFLAFAPDGAVAGVCRAEMSERLSERRGAPTSHIDAPGVVAKQRAADLYRPLLLAALGWLHSQRPAAVELESWGDEAATLATFEACGFAFTRQQTSYRIDLR